MAFDFIPFELAQRRGQSLLRSRVCVEESTGTLIRVDGQHYINFASNDYLGMRQSIDVLQGWVDGLSIYGAGSGASPLVTGYTKAHQDLENYLADSLEREKVLLFNSGFAANQAICQALMSSSKAKEACIVADKLIHASLIDGAMASDATLMRFRHNDMPHLQQQLSKTGKNTLVATEGIFSMDGDQGKLLEMLPIIKSHDAWLMLDDAHGFGVLGETGMGTAQALNLSQQQLPILMATFGKAIGTAGAFVAGSAELIDFLVNFARHYIYSTAMPPAQATATLASLKTLRSSGLRESLQGNIQHFRQLAKSAGINLMLSDSPIQPVVIGDAQIAVDVSEHLKSLGIWASAIRYPTVPRGTDRLRITITASHQERDIVALVDALQIALRSISKGYK